MAIGMVEWIISQEFRFKHIEEIKNYFINEMLKWIDELELQRRLYSFKLYWALLISASVVTGCVLMSVFASLIVIPIWLRVLH